MPNLLALLQSGFDDYNKHRPISPYNPRVRIIAGELKGREVSLPRGSRIRPATGAIRETVINLFRDARLTHGPFIDMCAGSGLVGFEALSRGAPRVVFVETDARTAAGLRQTAERFGVADRCTVLRMDARRCYSALSKSLGMEPAASVFLDPPYIMGMAVDLVSRLGRQSSVIHAEGLVIVRAMERLPDEIPGLLHLSHRETGKHWIYLYEPDHSFEVDPA